MLFQNKIKIYIHIYKFYFYYLFQVKDFVICAQYMDEFVGYSIVFW